jgi:hydrogenase maturation protease
MGLVVFGYGNPGRGDDALGPALTKLLASASPSRPRWSHIHIVEDLQLHIEHALDLEGQTLALFVDASLSGPVPYRFQRVKAAQEIHYTSHAMSPAAVMHVFEEISKDQAPAAYQLGIRGECFTLGTPLSDAARRNLSAAYRFVCSLCEHQDPAHWDRFLLWKPAG